MTQNQRASLFLLLVPICLCLTGGCGRKSAVAEPPGFADLPPVPREWTSNDPEVLKWRELLKSVYRAIGAEAHWKLKKEGRVTFRLKDLPREQREVLAEFLTRGYSRDWVESKVGRPPDLGRLTFAFEGSRGGTVTFVVLDPSSPGSGGLRCADIGGWPEEGEQR